MTKISLLLLVCVTLIWDATGVVWAKKGCSKAEMNADSSRVLSCFIQSKSSVPASHRLISHAQIGDISYLEYELISQFWPEADISSSGRIWRHRLSLYVPNQLDSEQALILIGSGTNTPKPDELTIQPVPDTFNLLLADIAVSNSTLVAELKDIPNQYITFDDGIPRKEDGILAYTWNKYLDDPKNNAFWPGHLPMAKAVVKAMDAIQLIADERDFEEPEHFALAGASKRGWTAWLTSLADRRVNLLIPIVIDVMNTKQNLMHIHHSLGDWPFAFADYVEQGVTERIDSLAFDKLMQIQDPLLYLNHKRYLRRLSIPKFIINAANDDFFVPDSLLQYINFLPGNNTLRVLPNQGHQVDMQLVGKAIKDYYGLFLDRGKGPRLNWSVSQDKKYIEITTHFVPEGAATLWTSHNPDARDFRIYPAQASYVQADIEGQCSKKLCVFRIPNNVQDTGWTSRLVEFEHVIDGHALTISSPAFISPDIYP